MHQEEQSPHRSTQEAITAREAEKLELEIGKLKSERIYRPVGLAIPIILAFVVYLLVQGPNIAANNKDLCIREVNLLQTLDGRDGEAKAEALNDFDEYEFSCPASREMHSGMGDEAEADKEIDLANQDLARLSDLIADLTIPSIVIPPIIGPGVDFPPIVAPGAGVPNFGPGVGIPVNPPELNRSACQQNLVQPVADQISELQSDLASLERRQTQLSSDYSMALARAETALAGRGFLGIAACGPSCQRYQSDVEVLAADSAAIREEVDALSISLGSLSGELESAVQVCENQSVTPLQFSVPR